MNKSFVGRAESDLKSPHLVGVVDGCLCLVVVLKDCLEFRYNDSPESLHFQRFLLTVSRLTWDFESYLNMYHRHQIRELSNY